MMWDKNFGTRWGMSDTISRIVRNSTLIAFRVGVGGKRSSEKFKRFTISRNWSGVDPAAIKVAIIEPAEVPATSTKRTPRATASAYAPTYADARHPPP